MLKAKKGIYEFNNNLVNHNNGWIGERYNYYQAKKSTNKTKHDHSIHNFDIFNTFNINCILAFISNCRLFNNQGIQYFILI